MQAAADDAAPAGPVMRVPRPPPLPNHTWPDWLAPLAPVRMKVVFRRLFPELIDPAVPIEERLLNGLAKGTKDMWAYGHVDPATGEHSNVVKTTTGVPIQTSFCLWAAADRDAVMQELFLQLINIRGTTYCSVDERASDIYPACRFYLDCDFHFPDQRPVSPRGLLGVVTEYVKRLQRFFKCAALFVPPPAAPANFADAVILADYRVARHVPAKSEYSAGVHVVFPFLIVTDYAWRPLLEMIERAEGFKIDAELFRGHDCLLPFSAEPDELFFDMVAVERRRLRIPFSRKSGNGSCYQPMRYVLATPVDGEAEWVDFPPGNEALTVAPAAYADYIRRRWPAWSRFPLQTMGIVPSTAQLSLGAESIGDYDEYGRRRRGAAAAWFLALADPQVDLRVTHVFTRVRPAEASDEEQAARHGANGQYFAPIEPGEGGHMVHVPNQGLRVDYPGFNENFNDFGIPYGIGAELSFSYTFAGGAYIAEPEHLRGARLLAVGVMRRGVKVQGWVVMGVNGGVEASWITPHFIEERESVRSVYNPYPFLADRLRKCFPEDEQPEWFMPNMDDMTRIPVERVFTLPYAFLVTPTCGVVEWRTYKAERDAATNSLYWPHALIPTLPCIEDRAVPQREWRRAELPPATIIPRYNLLGLAQYVYMQSMDRVAPPDATIMTYQEVLGVDNRATGLLRPWADLREEYLPSLYEEPATKLELVYVDAPCSSGKTFMVETLLEEALRAGWTVVWMAPRQTLAAEATEHCRAVAVRAGLPRTCVMRYHSSVAQLESLDHVRVYVTTFNSLMHLVRPESGQPKIRPDLLVRDEVNTAIRDEQAGITDHMRALGRAVWTAMLSNCRMCISMDADFRPLNVTFVPASELDIPLVTERQRRQIRFTLLRHTGQRPPARQQRVAFERTDYGSLLIAMRGELNLDRANRTGPIAVYCSELQFLSQMLYEIEQFMERPLKIVRVTGPDKSFIRGSAAELAAAAPVADNEDDDDDNAQQQQHNQPSLKDRLRALPDLDIFAYTGTIDVGMDINQRDYIQAVFAVIASNVGTPIAVDSHRQAVERVRHFRRLYFYVRSSPTTGRDDLLDYSETRGPRSVREHVADDAKRMAGNLPRLFTRMVAHINYSEAVRRDGHVVVASRNAMEKCERTASTGLVRGLFIARMLEEGYTVYGYRAPNSAPAAAKAALVRIEEIRGQSALNATLLRSFDLATPAEAVVYGAVTSLRFSDVDSATSRKAMMCGSFALFVNARNTFTACEMLHMCQLITSFDPLLRHERLVWPDGGLRILSAWNALFGATDDDIAKVQCATTLMLMQRSIARPQTRAEVAVHACLLLGVRLFHADDYHFELLAEREMQELDEHGEGIVEGPAQAPPAAAQYVRRYGYDGADDAHQIDMPQAHALLARHERWLKEKIGKRYWDMVYGDGENGDRNSVMEMRALLARAVNACFYDIEVFKVVSEQRRVPGVRRGVRGDNRVYVRYITLDRSADTDLMRLFGVYRLWYQNIHAERVVAEACKCHVPPLLPDGRVVSPLADLSVRAVRVWVQIWERDADLRETTDMLLLASREEQSQEFIKRHWLVRPGDSAPLKRSKTRVTREGAAGGVA